MKNKKNIMRMWLCAGAAVLLVAAGCGDSGSSNGVSGCGDGVVDTGEVCDDGNNVSGDGCSGDCQSDESCGNGYLDWEAGEQCDDGNTTADDGCSDTCQSEFCGNNQVDPGETCDDGNNASGDGCSGDCQSDESCGNSYLDWAAGEECDDGNTTASDGCSDTCQLEYCGNGVVDAGEECEDGNNVDDDYCSNACLDATCSDTVRNGVETDVDCGGADCTGCAVGMDCNVAGDCLSGACPSGVCLPTKTITVDSADPTALADFQVLVELNTTNFDYADARLDGRDIRFSTDGVNFDIPHWIETWDASGPSRVWVKVPSIPASGSVDIYLIYGDFTLSNASDGDLTFDFFDDFEDGAYANKWDVHGTFTTLTESNGELFMEGTSNWEYVGAKTSFAGPVVIHAEAMMIGMSAGLVVADANSDYRYTFRETGGITGTTYDADVSGSNTWETMSYPGTPHPFSAWHDINVAVTLTGGSVEVLEYCNGASCTSGPHTYNQTGITAFVPGFSSWNASNDLSARLIYVRKYSAYAVTATVN